MTITVIHADCRAAIADMADCSVDSVASDPPYALGSIVERFGADNAAQSKADGPTGVYRRQSAGFMGQKWDTGEVAFDPAFWAEVRRVLKPGGHVVAFGGTRTFHRLACAIEDGGFEIRDMLAWMYGSGFPKSHDFAAARDDDGKKLKPRQAASGFVDMAQADGWGTALKPALEPICFARKPLAGTVAANVLAHGTGALNIDACRVGHMNERELNRNASIGYGGSARGGHVAIGGQGRWPANVLHDGSAEVMEAFPDTKVGGSVAKGGTSPNPMDWGKERADGFSAYGGDEGSAARFFYSAKADAADRLESKHPTVKPVDLMAWLVRLVTPPGGVVLDPFAGSGSTGMAAMREGFDAILIEREAAYVADIRRRIAHVQGGDTPLFAEVASA